MKTKRLIYALLLSAICFCITYSATAQDSNGTSYDENARVDTLADAYAKDEVTKDLKRQNSKNLSELKSEKREPKAKAKEAQRVEDEANHAARESKIAYRKEKKAQRVREEADKQSRSAQKTRAKSDKN